MSKLAKQSKLNITAQDFVYIENMNIEGTKARPQNYTVAFDAPTVYIKKANLSKIDSCYNVYEQPQTVKSPIQKFTAVGISNSGNPMAIGHNIFNIYNVADNAEILIKDCSFDLNMASSNVMRLSNYTNAKNVTVTFENVNWTYKNADINDDDKGYAGLLLIQKVKATEALNGWTVNFNNCKYNGVPVTSINPGEENQVMYTYKYDVNVKPTVNIK